MHGKLDSGRAIPRNKIDLTYLDKIEIHLRLPQKDYRFLKQYTLPLLTFLSSDVWHTPPVNAESIYGFVTSEKV